MYLDFTQLWLLVGGLVFSAFGWLIVFSKTFREMWWRKEDESALDRKLFAGKSGYYFDRYGRGLGSATLGLLMLAAFVGTVSKAALPALTVIAAPVELLSTGYGRLIVVVLLIIGIYGLLRISLNHAKKKHSGRDSLKT
jgi:hypothetical protein